MITIINYGLGNINAFGNILKNQDFKFKIAKNSDELKGATKIILPGVGSFDWAMHKINSSGMREKLDELVLEKKVPVLGICVGMQIMAKSSEEGKEKGLQWINAEVLKFKQDANRTPALPHMGWNKIKIKESKIFRDISDPKFYFLHSYYIKPIDNNISIAIAKYKEEFTCSIKSSSNIYGVQFHPEKSHRWGKQLIKNFALL